MKDFFSLYDKVLHFSLLAQDADQRGFEYNRLLLIYLLVKATEDIKGAIIELGAYRGGTGYMMASITNKQVYLLDTFEGLPVPTGNDKVYQAGKLKAEVQEVYRLCNLSNILVMKGLFADVFKVFKKDVNFSFIHLDADLYQSTKEGIEWAYPKLSKGGVVVIDDYYDTGGGAKKAIDEYFKDKDVKKMKGFRPQLILFKE